MIAGLVRTVQRLTLACGGQSRTEPDLNSTARLKLPLQSEQASAKEEVLPQDSLPPTEPDGPKPHAYIEPATRVLAGRHKDLLFNVNSYPRLQSKGSPSWNEQQPCLETGSFDLKRHEPPKSDISRKNWSLARKKQSSAGIKPGLLTL